MRRYETRDSDHARAVARALLDAADDPHQVRVVDGGNGRQSFEVDDDFPDVTVPEPEPAPEKPARNRGPRAAQDAKKATAAKGDQARKAPAKKTTSKTSSKPKTDTE